MPTIDESGESMPKKDRENMPPVGPAPDLEKLNNILFGMEETIRRTRNFIRALGWSAARFHERYGVDVDECDAFDAVLGEAELSVCEVFQSWNRATDILSGRKGAA